jgi:hypothetical protein
MTLGLASEIIRAHELSRRDPPATLAEVTGVVLVDEIDLHLHISFQKDVLPALIRYFPAVQFIFTSHSPFFLLGMAETGEVDIVNLPVGNRIAPEEFSEFNSDYTIFLKSNEQFRARYQLLREQVETEGRPLVITEGKTDWQHVKRALRHFQASGEFNDLDIEFLEFGNGETMGDEKLAQMCETAPLLRLRRRCIFMFDRDKPKIISKMGGAPPEKFRTVSRDVFSFCIPVPAHRTGYQNITTEMYYVDADLRRVDPITQKRLWFSNEIEEVREPTTGAKEYRTRSDPRPDVELKKWVFDEPADNIRDATGRPVGLSKAAFVSTIVDHPQIGPQLDRSEFRRILEVLKEISELS